MEFAYEDRTIGNLRCTDELLGGLVLINVDAADVEDLRGDERLVGHAASETDAEDEVVGIVLAHGAANDLQVFPEAGDDELAPSDGRIARYEECLERSLGRGVGTGEDQRTQLGFPAVPRRLVAYKVAKHQRIVPAR